MPFAIRLSPFKAVIARALPGALGLLGATVVAIAPAWRSGSAPPAFVARRPAIGAAIPLRFEPIGGSAGPARAYLAHGAGYAIVLDRAGAEISLDGARPSRDRGRGRSHPGRVRGAPPAPVRMRLIAGSPRATLAPAGPPAGRVNYFVGRDRSRWRLGVPAYAGIVERGAWPGIDLIYYGVGGRMEFDLAIAPHARLASVRLELSGARAARVDQTGNLVLATAAGALRLMRPTVYAESGARAGAAPTRSRVDGRYAILARRDGRVTIGFRLGPHDPKARVVIDPALDYASFLGGVGRDVATAVAADAAGDVFVAGMTTSPDFPVTPGAIDSSCWYCSNRGSDFFASAFVSELRPAATGATQLVYSTYLGGSDGWGGGAAAIALDSRGYAHLAGVTDSSDFPVTPGAVERSCAGREQPFLAILNPSAAGTAQLVYASCIGGRSAYAGATALALDSAGRDYLAGYTADADFPVTADALEASCPGCGAGRSDGFLSVIDSSVAGGAGLIYSTFIGGGGNPHGAGDAATSLAVAASGDVWLAGTTGSDDFPTTSGAIEPSCPSAAAPNGCGAGFVAHLRTNAGAPALAYATYLGGSVNGDGIAALALAPDGDPVVAGGTFSPDFPVSDNAYQKKCGGGCAHGDAFVAVIAPNAPPPRQLSYASFLGGGGSAAGGDSATAIAAAPDGDIYLAGAALSLDFPITADAAQSQCVACAKNPPAPNAFVAIVRPSAARARSLVYATYLGGSGGFDGTSPAGDAAIAIAFDPASGGLYVVGGAASADFPVTANGYQTRCPGCLDGQGGNAFVAHFTAPADRQPTPTPTATPSPTPAPDPAGSLEYRPGRLNFGAARIGRGARRRTLTLRNRDRAPIAIAGIAVSGGPDFAATSACGPILAAGRRCAVTVSFRPQLAGRRQAALEIVDNARNSPQTIELFGTGLGFPRR